MNENDFLSHTEKEYLLKLARYAIEKYAGIDSQKPQPPDSVTLTGRMGAFVTLHKRGRLRGCIGFIEGEKPLYKTVMEAAVLAASEDLRFPPVKAPELNDLELEISVLSVPEPCNTYEEIELGKHGLIMRQKYYRGLLLPQVPVEHQMNKEEYLTAICEKSGAPGDLWKREKINLLKFTALVFSEKEVLYEG